MVSTESGLELGQHDDAKTFSDLGIDSLSIVDLVNTVEDRYGVTISDSEIPTLNSVSAITAYLHKTTS